MRNEFKATQEYAVQVNTYFINIGAGSPELRQDIEIYYRIADRYGLLEGDKLDDDLDQFFRSLDYKRFVMAIPAKLVKMPVVMPPLKSPLSLERIGRTRRRNKLLSWPAIPS